jgi:hypothetical protein
MASIAIQKRVRLFFMRSVMIVIRCTGSSEGGLSDVKGLGFCKIAFYFGFDKDFEPWIRLCTLRPASIGDASFLKIEGESY